MKSKSIHFFLCSIVICTISGCFKWKKEEPSDMSPYIRTDYTIERYDCDKDSTFIIQSGHQSHNYNKPHTYARIDDPNFYEYPHFFYQYDSLCFFIDLGALMGEVWPHNHLDGYLLFPADGPVFKENYQYNTIKAFRPYLDFYISENISTPYFKLQLDSAKRPVYYNVEDGDVCTYSFKKNYDDISAYSLIFQVAFNRQTYIDRLTYRIDFTHRLVSYMENSTFHAYNYKADYIE